MSQAKITLVVFPNPNNGVFSVSVSTDNALEVTLMIVNSVGYIMLKQQKNLVQGRNLIQMNQRQWPSGTYELGLLKAGVVLNKARFIITHGSGGS